MVKDLVALGVTERKSLTVRLPPMSDEMFPHFLRGLIDGDGCVRNDVVGVSITGSTYLIPEVVERLSKILGIKTRPLSAAGKAVSVHYTGDDAEKLIRYVYQPGYFALPRKHYTAMQAIRDRGKSFCVTCNSEIPFVSSPTKRRRRRRYCASCKRDRQREANRECYRRRQDFVRRLHGIDANSN
jgi:hypothetical protein